MGGKSRTCKKIMELITEICDPKEYKIFIEPFCGSVNVTIQANKYYDVYASDYNESVIMLWKHCQQGLYENIEDITFEDYKELKYSPNSWRKGAIGPGMSYRGTWFNGFDNKRGIKKVNNSINKKKDLLNSVKFNYCSYENNKETEELIKLGNCIIYCDPPYDNTNCNYETKKFNSEEFWKKAKQWSDLGNKVFISEKSCPIEHKIINSWKITNNMNGKETYDNLYLII